MKKGALFVGHSESPGKRIMVGVKGSRVHTAILTLEEALRLAEHLIATVKKLHQTDISLTSPGQKSRAFCFANLLPG
jgi:hypothetical protein